MSRVVALPLVLVFLSRCAFGKADVWTRPDVTASPSSAISVNASLTRLTRQTPFGSGGYYIHLDRGTYETCMAQRGYTLSNAER